MHVVLFAALLAATCGYALWRGGAPERIVAAALLAAFAGSELAYTGLAERFSHVEPGVFAIDLVLMAVLLAVALHADRGWPLLLAGLHLSSLGAHLAKAADVPMIRVTYAILIAIWSYPMLFALALGTWRHERRLRRFGADLDWTFKPRRTRRAPGEPHG